MAKNEKNYKLSSDAVDSLLDAEKGKVPEYSKEELKKYRSKEGFHIPEPVKIMLLKAWFAGAVCFFFIWGLGNILASMLDRLVIVSIVWGMATNIIVNNIIRFMETEPGDNDRWMMVTSKSMLGLLLDLVYGVVVIAFVFMLYNVINMVCIAVTGNVETIYLGVEPILFGLFTMGIDMLFVTVKNFIVDVVTRKK